MLGELRRRRLSVAGVWLPSDLTLPEVTSSGRPRAHASPTPRPEMSILPTVRSSSRPHSCGPAAASLSPPSAPRKSGCCLLWGCTTSSPQETPAPGTWEALTDHLVTECNSEQKPAFLFSLLVTSIL